MAVQDRSLRNFGSLISLLLTSNVRFPTHTMLFPSVMFPTKLFSQALRNLKKIRTCMHAYNTYMHMIYMHTLAIHLTDWG